MRRNATVTVVAALALALAACGDDGGGSVEAFCDSAQDFADVGDPFQGNPEEFSDLVQDNIDAINAINATAPDEISEDAETAADGTIPVFTALLDLDDPTDEEAIAETLSEFEDTAPEVQTAINRVNAYALDQCGIDLEATADAPTGQQTVSEALMVDFVRDEANDGASEFTDSVIVEYGTTVCDAADEDELEGFFSDLLAELRAEGITEPEGDARFVAVGGAIFALCPEHDGQWEQVIANVEQLYPE